MSDLLKTYELKKFDSLVHCSPDAVNRLRTKFIKLLCAQKGAATTPNDFVVKIREIFTESLLTNADLASEIETFELAKKVRSLMWENRAGKCADKDSNWKMISISEAEKLVTKRKDLPFSIPDHFIDKFKEQIETHNKLRSATSKALTKDCTIDQIKPLHEQAKALVLGSELATDLAKMVNDYTLLDILWSQIQ
jgi:hypothetical protein